MDFNIINLLPHDPDIQVKDITFKLRYIKLFRLVLKASKNALICFKNKELFMFDAQVGETLCQIRAYKIAKLSNNYRFEAELDAVIIALVQAELKLKKAEQELNGLINIHKNKRPVWVKEVNSLISLLKEKDAYFSFSEEIFYLFLSYFLCLYNVRDEEGIPFTIDYEKIVKDFDVSPSYSKKIVQYYQKMISQLSCDFVFNLLDDIEEKDSLKKVLPSLCLLSDEGRKALPCYAVTEIILLHAIKSKINIVMYVKSLNNEQSLVLTFRGSSEYELELLDLNSCNSDEPCLVFYGVSKDFSSLHEHNFLNDLLNIGIKSLILYNNAFHPQYSGKTLSYLSQNPFKVLMNEGGAKLSKEFMDNLHLLSAELDAMKEMAKSVSCTALDQNMFLLKHIFCDTVHRYRAQYKLLARNLVEEAQVSMAA